MSQQSFADLGVSKAVVAIAKRGIASLSPSRGSSSRTSSTVATLSPNPPRALEDPRLGLPLVDMASPRRGKPPRGARPRSHPGLRADRREQRAAARPRPVGRGRHGGVGLQRQAARGPRPYRGRDPGRLEDSSSAARSRSSTWRCSC